MKINLIVFPLVFALAATLATTGCKKGQPKLTTLPGSLPAQVGDTGLHPTISGGTPLTPEPGPYIGPGPGPTPTTGLDEFEGMIKDPAALAANTIHFAFDSAAIKKSEDPNISSVAAALKASANDKLLIEGNCD